MGKIILNFLTNQMILINHKSYYYNTTNTKQGYNNQQYNICDVF